MPAYPAISFIESPEGFNRSGPLDNVIRSPMEQGPVKSRRRFTAAPRAISGSTDLITDAEVATFETWYRDEIGDGAIPFTADHPITGVSTTFRFTQTYEIVYLNDDINRINMQLEILP